EVTRLHQLIQRSAESELGVLGRY
ncbi:hypothetical protein OYC64_011357, partial [Pagothenia borchgrevinki]